MTLVIKPQQRSTWWHWSVLTLLGLSITYSWLWVLTYRPIHQPNIEIDSGLDVESDASPLNIVLEAPRATSGSPSVVEQPVEHASTPTAPPVSVAESPPAQIEAIEPVAMVAAVTPPLPVPKLQTPAPAPIRNSAPLASERSAIIPAALTSNAQIPAPPMPTPPPPGEHASAATPAENHSSTPVDNASPTPAGPTENSIAANTGKPNPPTAPATSGLDPVPVSRLTRTPTFVHKALPADPEDVQIPLGGVRVIARITLDETAVVRDVQIDKSGEPPFDVAVISAIHRSRFTPGYVGDQPVATVFNQTYRFQLQ